MKSIFKTSWNNFDDLYRSFLETMNISAALVSLKSQEYKENFLPFCKTLCEVLRRREFGCNYEKNGRVLFPLSNKWPWWRYRFVLKLRKHPNLEHHAGKSNIVTPSRIIRHCSKTSRKSYTCLGIKLVMFGRKAWNKCVGSPWWKCLVQRFQSERLRVRSRRSATFTPSTHVRRQSLPVWPPTLNKIPLPLRTGHRHIDWTFRRHGLHKQKPHFKVADEAVRAKRPVDISVFCLFQSFPSKEIIEYRKSSSNRFGSMFRSDCAAFIRMTNGRWTETGTFKVFYKH